ncbi:MAG: hypothetical protein Q9160_003523 [Pyrenula sp. 1 TL-2023]
MADATMLDVDDLRKGDEAEQSSTSDEEDEDTDSVEALALGRERRANAGNRMRGLVEDEAEDELTLLFGEEGEDEEFEESVDEGSDNQITDSEDEDRASNPEDDELAGEKEIQREAKAERAKKRKKEDIFTAPRKKQKPLPATDQDEAAVSRPKKKKDHVFTLAEEGDSRIRVSLREATKATREVMREKMKVDKERHDAMTARLVEKRIQREREKPKEMTQADRLNEAEKVEKKNAKSLNRWEATERKRAEEQKAKLEALQNRKLEGPVISWWSGVARWLGERLTRVGSRQTQAIPAVSEPKKRGRKPKNANIEVPTTKEGGTAESSNVGTPAGSATASNPEIPAEKNVFVTPAPSRETSDTLAMQQSTTTATLSIPNSPPPAPIPSESPTGNAPTEEQHPPASFLSGIHEYASLSTEPTQPPPTISLPPQSPSASIQNTQSSPIVSAPISQQPRVLFPASTPDQALPSDPVPAPPPPPPPEPSNSTRNLLVLQNFESLSNPSTSHPILFTSKRAPKPSTKYRDPKTNIPYANAAAYKKLRALESGRYQWSGMLGCYVGERGKAAMGVPDGFLPSTGNGS